MNVTHIGMDLAKSVFSVHGVDRHGHTRVQKTLRRAQVLAWFAQHAPCTVGLESCGGAHYWARELAKLGHQVRLINPRFVKPFLKSHKNDRNDAEAICEALMRPSMRFVAVKSAEQQAELSVHRARKLLATQRVAVMNQLRGLLSEFGLVAPLGPSALRRALPQWLEDPESALPGEARETFAELYAHWLDIERRLERYDTRISQMAKRNDMARRLMALPGIGPITATAIIATVGDMSVFDNARQFSAWLGLVPRHFATGGKTRYGRITKAGDAYLRTLLIHGARAALRTAPRRQDATSRWALALRERRGTNKAIVALAAKHARIIWAMLARDLDYQPPQACA